MILTEPASLDHLIALSDDVGVIQHAVDDIPNRDTGYCVDDVARAFHVAVMAEPYPALTEVATRLGTTYLAYLFQAQRVDGKMRDFMGYDRRWLDDDGTEDAFGRAFAALSYGLRHARRAGWRAICARILDAALPHVHGLEHLRARSAVAIGLSHVVASPSCRPEHVALLREIVGVLSSAFAATATPEWAWFEPWMTYDNARLCEAMFRGAQALEDSAALDVAKRAYAFYERMTIEDETFVPIGNDGWAYSDGRRARFDQQPLEAAAMVDASLAAFDATGEQRYLLRAELAYDWFFGRNAIGAPLVLDGGCRDGFGAGGVNRNMGAESTLAYLSSAFMSAPYRIEASDPAASR